MSADRYFIDPTPADRRADTRQAVLFMDSAGEWHVTEAPPNQWTGDEVEQEVHGY